jgi:HK97 family phage major capsid protein
MKRVSWDTGEQRSVVSSLSNGKRPDVAVAERPEPFMTPVSPHQQKASRSLGDLLLILRKGWLHAGPGRGVHADEDRVICEGMGVERAWTGGLGGAAGGYLIKPEWVELIWDRAREFPCCERVIWRAKQSRETFVRLFYEQSRVDGSRMGGIASYWQGEQEIASLSSLASFPSMAQVEFYDSRLIVYTIASRDLIADALLWPETIGTAVGREFMFKFEQGIVTGNGLSQPLGIMNAPATIAVTRHAGGTIADLDIQNMWTSIWGPCRRNAIWLANDDTLANLDVIAATNNWPESIYVPAGVYGNPTPMVKGRPLLPAEACAVYGSQGDLICFDPSQYWFLIRLFKNTARPDMTVSVEVPVPEVAGAIREKDVVEARMSEHKLFDSDQVSYLFKCRGDGKPVWPVKLTNYRGNATVSYGAIIHA